MKKQIIAAAFGVVSMGLFVGVSHAATLDDVKSKGFVQCGVSQGLPGFSNPDADGNWTGLDVDYCRGLAGGEPKDSAAIQRKPIP